MKLSSSRILRIIVTIYGLLYFILIAIPVIKSGFDPEPYVGGMVEVISILFAAILFITGATISWRNEKIGGILICIWHLLVWAFALFIWIDAGMIIVLILPMLYAGALLIRNWYLRVQPNLQDGLKKDKLLLQILLINYAGIYLLIIISNVFPKGIMEVIKSEVSRPGFWGFPLLLIISLIIALLLFIAGFIYSWNSEFKAGIIFISWYVLIGILALVSPVFANTGPWIVGGLVLLIQGILYIQLVKKPQLFIN